MSRAMKALLVLIAAASGVGQTSVQAAGPRDVSCSVSVDYTLNGGLPQSYKKDFVVLAGGFFYDDFGTFVRFREFYAFTSEEAGNTVVSIDYYNDVGVFDAVDFRTSLTLHEENGETISGSQSFYTSRPFSAAHRTHYTLTCSRLKN